MGSLDRKVIFGAAAALVTALALGIGAGFYFGGRGASAELALLRAQIEKAKSVLAPAGQRQTVLGTVERVEGSVIFLKAQAPANPFEEAYPEDREAVVTAETKIVRQVSKPPATYLEELLAYQRQLPGQEQASAYLVPTPPSPVAETAVAAGSLKSGDRIVVQAREDITAKTRFEAVQITVLASS
ncbi:MAG: hypothetical protein A3A43_01590 [Candidatus Liptonbacteria bacterium RIFCSPLOWO2_01_FULL_56_20]|uniref:Uncharacterized protein n=1 Tax=Candidatus Liptonbacteria bacterium RIFCSPLOWO2_01_FULL_56_20 TaxID=1798652 RepID=A0A1G2CK43_9BACT|nr:MAG: hypothetical protein UY96_C0001G0043 [Parcubacteria group bacterium GW2011_GWB1_56_8]OGY97915.1 MAG: hypothetical protein A2681_00995 [Candidatus Liptonbacteria bacterium RIFCSPHIGHO2_01_FULL_56_18b]OGZ01582.1 MAG: hypothetical protein A3A43_01590 [Candidatus Liptonbacteria bacterium RIFCSPLOWO2_01_FULL_56_20]